MKIRFCLDDGGEQLYEMETQDVAGVIEAAKGEKILFHDEFYKYDHHILNHYLNNGQWFQELIIYVRDY